MIALLRNIRNLKCRIEELKKSKSGINDVERRKRIDAQIALLESIMETHKALTTDFVNQLPKDLRDAVSTYFYSADSWDNVEVNFNGKYSKDYFRISIERLCDKWDTQ